MSGDSRVFPTVEVNLGLADRSDRVRIEVAGPDRAKFLHNLTTNEVKRLPAGKGCEAFVTNLQGKTIAYVIMLAEDDRILLRSDAGGAALALPHLRKYGVFDDVTIEDASESTFEFHLAGLRAAELVGEVGGRLPEEREYAHVATDIAGEPVRVIRESPTVLPGLTLIGPASSAQRLRTILLKRGRDLGLIELDPLTFDVLRIEAGTPVFGKDLTDRNLPQEIGRDDRAINFVKGCYLGQETVARIDALGHVNQILRGLRIVEPSSSRPEPGWVLKDGDKRVGVVTSAAFSPRQRATVALAMVRATHSNPGVILSLGPPDGESEATATVSALPLSPPT
jgi:tRNA-modifying protein YgfZ